jgi:hypothetical protein
MYERASEKVVFAAISCKEVYRPFFFAGLTITGVVHLDTLQNVLITQLDND